MPSFCLTHSLSCVCVCACVSLLHGPKNNNSVLIDDRISLKDDWEKAGGIFIHHIDTETTLRELREHGILNDELPDEEALYGDGSWRIWKP
jgi:hypothetical protein